MADMVDQPGRIVGGDEHRFRAAVAQRRHRLRRLAEQALAHLVDILDIEAGEAQRAKAVDFREGLQEAQRIIDCDRPGLAQLLQQRRDRRQRERMADRLEEGMPAGQIVEGLDLQRHVASLFGFLLSGESGAGQAGNSFLKKAEIRCRLRLAETASSLTTQFSWMERRWPTKGLWPCQAFSTHLKATMVPKSGETSAT